MKLEFTKMHEPSKMRKQIKIPCLALSAPRTLLAMPTKVSAHKSGSLGAVMARHHGDDMSDDASA